MNGKMISKLVIFLVIIFLTSIIPVESALWNNEGSVTIKAGERKSIYGVACIYSENPVLATYTVQYSNIEKFVERVEPQDFTVDRIPCGGGDEGRKCVAKLCNEDSNYTRMITTHFIGPVEFTFDELSFDLHTSTVHDYQGSIQAIGRIGAVIVREPIGFIVHFYPYNGWLMIFVVIIIVVLIIIVIVFLLTKKLKGQIPRQTESEYYQNF